MANLADDYVKDFSKKLLSFPDYFDMFWGPEKFNNNSFVNMNEKDRAYFITIRDFVKAQINQFAETLPAKGKEHIDDFQKKADDLFSRS